MSASDDERKRDGEREGDVVDDFEEQKGKGVGIRAGCGYGERGRKS